MRVSGSAGTIAALGELLARTSYDEESVRELVRPDGIDGTRGAAALRLRPDADGPLGRLVRLFLSGDELGPDVAAETLAPLTVAELEAAGIVRTTANGVTARVTLTPLRGLVVAGDPRPSGRFPTDHVLPPGPASEVLAKSTIRNRVGSALDLCSGSGVQALLAARHADRVVGTDLSRRCLHLAATSATLSGIENVEWRQGDLFEPVSDESFDLVVSNPPFVISPAREVTFRDGGRRGDELSREVATGVASVLADGGFGFVLCSWVSAPGELWSRAPRRWLWGRGCDVVILDLGTETPASYAIRWTSADAETTAEAAERAERWVDYYAELGVAQITTGLIAMRRRSGGNWAYSNQPCSLGWEAGAHVARVFDGVGTMRALPNPRTLLDRRVSMASGVRLVETWSPADGLEGARLTADEGLGFHGEVEPPTVAAALRALETSGTAGEAADAARVDPEELDEFASSLANLVRSGHLTVA